MTYHTKLAVAAYRKRPDMSLTWINRLPSAPLRQGPVNVHRMVRRDRQLGDQKMEKISSFKVGAAILGFSALLKISVFAIVIAMLGITSPAQAGSLGRPCTDAPQKQWLSVEALQSKVEALGFKVQMAKVKNGCGELYALNKLGNRVELFVDPSDGHVVGLL